MDAHTLLTPIEQIRYRPATCVKVGTPALEVAHLMQTQRVGCVLVVNEKQQLTGIVTDRDFLRLASRGRDPMRRAKVDDCMTPDPDYLHTSDPLAHALNLMSFGRFRHVPLVANESRQPVGYLSSADIARHIAKSIECDLARRSRDP